MERVLITGADGVVGGNLALSLSDRFDVVAVTHAAPLELPGCRMVTCDGVQIETSVAEAEAPQWVIHAGPLAVSSWESELLDGVSAEDWAADLCYVERLASFASRTGADLTVIASDAVFAGPGLFHEESSLRCGSGALACAARALEDSLHKTGALIVRTNAYGFSPLPTNADLAERAWLALTTGETPSAATEPHATPILATDLAELLVLAHQRRERGVLHLCGAERTSPARFVAELAAAVGTSYTAARPGCRESLDPVCETSLDTRCARRELGVPMPLLREGLTRFVDQAHSGWRARLQASGSLCSAAA